jgi:ketosteroid isomerase-like protein
MKRIVIAVWVVVLAFSVAILAQSAKPKSGSAEQELIKLEQQWGDALVKPDLAFLDRILAEDYMFTSPNGEVLTKAQMLAELKSGEDVVSSEVNLDMKVRVYGDAAVVTGYSTSKETVKGKDISGEYRWTDTWIKKGGRWQCVADHASKVPAPIAPPGQAAVTSILKPELKLLERMLGDWTYEGENFPTPVWPAGKFSGKYSCLPFLNGAFVEVRGEEGGAPWYEVDGYDAASKKYFWHGYDAGGRFSLITMTVDGNTVTYSGTGLERGKQYWSRGTDVYSADSMTVIQKDEISIDGRTWIPGFEAKFVKNHKSK